MKFEEALSLMREGKKIRHPFFENDVYFKICRSGLIWCDIHLSEFPISIIKMKGDRQHEDMVTENNENFTQFPLFLIISDDWEIIE